jgi:hypothetical protein
VLDAKAADFGVDCRGNLFLSAFDFGALFG